MCSEDSILEIAQKEYLDSLVEAGLLIPSGVPGIYGRSGVFESVVEHFQRYVTHHGADQNAEVMHFPPVYNRSHYLQVDHIETFPNLMGSVHTFEGKERQHINMLQKREDGEDWSADLMPTDCMLVPAACYPLYPTATGQLTPEGRTVDLLTFVFRHEPSPDPARMQIFRQREYVRLGTPEQALSHRDKWIDLAESILKSLELNAYREVANDPFFGRGGRMMAATQREQDLKYEIVVPINSEVKPTAVASCNYHLDHFGTTFDIKTSDGQAAHTACVGFGLERIALALFKTHGLNPTEWPNPVREKLAL